MTVQNFIENHPIAHPYSHLESIQIALNGGIGRCAGVLGPPTGPRAGPDNGTGSIHLDASENWV